LVEIANLTYVIRSDHDPGYLDLVGGQLRALGYLPNLLGQGEAARDLVLASLLGRPVYLAGGLGLLAGEVAVVAVVAVVVVVLKWVGRK
jgi:hypothetical protein